MARAAVPSIASWSSVGRPRSPQRIALVACAGATAVAALLFLTWFCAFHVSPFQRADVSILGGFVDLHRPRVDSVASFIAGLCSPNPYVYLAAVPVLIALARRRPAWPS